MKKLYSTNNFYSRGFVYAFVSVIAAAVNYALYPLVARILSVEKFGEFAILMTLITQIAGILVAFSIVSLFISANNTEVESKKIISSIQKFLLYIFVLLTAIAILLSPMITHYFRLTDSSYVLISMLALVLSIPASFWMGYLQANGELQRVGLFNLFSASFKLVFAVIFSIMVGLKGTLWGLFIGTLLGLIAFWLMPGKKPPFIEEFRINSYDIQVFKKYLRLIGLYCLVIFALLVFQVFDISSVKSIFDSTTAGNYAGVATIAKIVFFTGSILIWIVLPEIAKNNKEKINLLVKKTYLIFGILSVIFLGLMSYFGTRIANMALGGDFHASNALYFWAILFQSSILFVTFQSLSLLLIGQKKFTLILISGLIALISLAVGHGLDLNALIRSYSIITLLVSVLLGINLRMAKYYEKND